jgi:hypothetical protein
LSRYELENMIRENKISSRYPEIGARRAAKARLKLVIVLAMIIGFWLAMPHTVLGERAHEWMGALLLISVGAHCLLNRKVLLTMLKGRHSVKRVMSLSLNALVGLVTLALMASGIILSRFVFDFLPLDGFSSWARIAHLLTSYWGVILVSIHLGYQWGGVASLMKEAGWLNFWFKPWPKPLVWSFGLLIGFILVYGFIAMAKLNFLSYMFLRSRFVYIDLERPLALFLLDYAAIITLWAFLGQGFRKLVYRRRIECSAEILAR